MGEHAKRLLVLCAALAVGHPARAAEVKVFSRCSEVTLEGVEVTLVLDGMAWEAWESLCEPVVRYLRPGEPPLGPQSAAEAKRLLDDTGFFGEATCHTSPEGLTCTVTPARMVYDVRIEGDVPFAILEDDLQRRIYLRPGILLEKEQEAMARQRKRLEDYLRREGYFGSVVRMRTTTVSGAEPNQGVRLWANVNPGRVVNLRKVTVHGWVPPEYGTDRIEGNLRHFWFLWWARERFRPTQFEDDLLRITSDLQDRGYPEARVEGDWHLDLTRREADVVLRLEAGPRLLLDFEGNRAVSDKKLRELATFKAAGVIDAVEIEDTAAAIRTRYQQAGYPDVKVAATAEVEGEHGFRVSYAIEEGAKAEVVEVRFAGNEAYDAARLERDVELVTSTGSIFAAGRWVEEQVAADARAIEAFYELQGYAAAEVVGRREPVGPGELAVIFAIAEGPRRMVTEVTLEGLPPEMDREQLFSRLQLTVGRPYIHSALGSDRRELLTTLAASGYSRATVRRQMERPKPSEGGPVVIHYRVEPGPKAVFGGVLVRGNFRTVRGLVENELSLEPGDALDLVALGRARRRLRALGPFFSVDLEALDLWRQEETTWLLVAVQERNVRALDAVGAFSTDDGFAVGLDYRDRNLLGRAIRLDLRLRTGTFGDLIPGGGERTGLRIGNTDAADVTLRAPRPLGAPFDFEGSAFYRSEDKAQYSEQRVGIGAGIVRQLLDRQACALCPDVTANLRYEVAAGQLEDRTQRFVAFERSYGVPRANTGRIVPALHLEHRDSFVDPRSGWAADTRFELAHAVLSPLPNGRTFWRLLVSGQGYLGLGTPFQRRLAEERILGGPLLLAVGLTWGASRPWGDTELIPESEAFFYGGDYSVRGAVDRASREGFPGATYLLVTNLELRWYFLQNFLFGSWQLALFADLGAVSYDFGDILQAPTISVGPALRYVTPVGPVSLAYGLGVVVPEAIVRQRPGAIPERGRLHLTFGYPF